jgi:hypothetical protein
VRFFRVPSESIASDKLGHQIEGAIMTYQSLPADRFTPGEFRLGHVFSQAWTVFSRNFFTFTLVTLIAGLPALLMPTRPRPAPGSAPTIPDNIGTIAALSLIVIVLKTLSQAVVLYGAFR